MFTNSQDNGGPHANAKAERALLQCPCCGSQLSLHGAGPTSHLVLEESGGVLPAAAGRMFIDPHAHMISRTTTDYEAMARAGVVAVVEPAFWLGQPRTNLGSYVDYLSTISASRISARGNSAFAITAASVSIRRRQTIRRWPRRSWRSCRISPPRKASWPSASSDMTSRRR